MSLRPGVSWLPMPREAGDGFAPSRPAWHARPVLRTLLAYLVAIILLAIFARSVPLDGLRAAFEQARPGLFLAACLAAALGWLIGGAFLFSRLFSDLLVPIGFVEMLPASAMHECLELLDSTAAGLAMIGFLRRRRGVPLLAAGGAMVLQGVIDFQVIAWFVLLAIPWAGPQAVPIAWYYPAAVLLGTWGFAALWHGPSRTRLGAWLRARPSLQAFRRARLRHYAQLSAIRATIYGTQAVALYVECRAFGIHAPPSQVLMLQASIMLLGALPIAPAGLGVRQGLTLLLLRPFAPPATLLAASLAHSAVLIVLRLLMGLIFAGSLARLLAEAPIARTILHDA